MTYSSLPPTFDSVMVLGLDEAEDVPDSGTDAGEHQACHHDDCEDHGHSPIRTDGLRAPPEKSPASGLVSSAPRRCNVLLRET